MTIKSFDIRSAVLVAGVMAGAMSVSAFAAHHEQGSAQGSMSSSSSDSTGHAGEKPSMKGPKQGLEDQDKMSSDSSSSSMNSDSMKSGGGDTDMPATAAQAKQLKKVPDDAAGARTREKGMEAGGMPATKAQEQQLKEADNMSSEKAESPGTN